MKKFNKATAAGISAAIIGLVGTLVDIEPETLAAIGTVLTAAIVYFVPNQEKPE